MNRILSFQLFLAVTLITVTSVGCRKTGSSSSVGYDVEVYSPREATGFEITKSDEGNSVMLTVHKPWQGADGQDYRLLILRDGATVPNGFEGQVINGDAKRIIAMSSTQVAMLEALGEAERLVGVSGLDFICSPSVANRRERPVDVGYDTSVDYEKILATKPDIVLLYGVDGNNPIEPKLRELGIPYIYVGEYLETSPLGKAEWIVAIGEIVGCRDKAVELYRGIASRYDSLVEKVKELDRPRVMMNAPYGDAWLMPSRDSYAARLIGDAGGEYVVSVADPDCTIAIDEEEIFMLASSADIWINTGNARTRSEFAAEVPRMTATPPFVNNRLYNNNKRRKASGGNDYYETAVIEPDSLLADLIMIFHPEVLPEGHTKYYRQLDKP